MSRSAPLLVFAAATVVPTVLHRFGSTLGLESMWVPIVVAFVVGFIGCWMAPRSIGLLFLALFVGVPLGVFVDAMTDIYVFVRGRNLLPIEIILWGKFFFIPAALGVFICRVFIAARNSEKENAI